MISQRTAPYGTPKTPGARANCAMPDTICRTATMIISHQAHIRSLSRPTEATIARIPVKRTIAPRATNSPAYPAYCGATAAMRAAAPRRTIPPNRAMIPNRMPKVADGEQPEDASHEGEPPQPPAEGHDAPEEGQDGQGERYRTANDDEAGEERRQKERQGVREDERPHDNCHDPCNHEQDPCDHRLHRLGLRGRSIHRRRTGRSIGGRSGRGGR